MPNNRAPERPTPNREENPLIPMGAITGAPTREFLYERLKNWRDRGVTQFMIYARSGLELEHMSEAWLDRCEWICEDAQALGFTSIWLYDERNWPSGTCNGEVLKRNPDHAIRALCVSEPRPGEYEFHLRRGSRMADLLNPDAVDSFIRLTHERYEKRLGRFFGKLIKGFFTDEPDIAFFYELYEGNVRTLPYYDGVEEDYRKLTGGDLKADIAHGLKIGADYWQGPLNRRLAKRFRTTFVDRISRWCAERGLVLTGHLMYEVSTDLALERNGHILEVLSGFTLPGIDDIKTKLCNDQAEYLTYSTGMYAIEKQGNRGGLAELFAFGPCDLTPEWLCARFYFCAAFGIDRYVMAVSQSVMRGNVEKRTWFHPFAEAQPWSEAYDELGECAKAAARWARKERDCDVAVRYPYEPQPLTDLLRHLADAQLNWKLFLPDEATDAPLVLSCANGTLKEERSGKTFFDFGMLDKTFLCRFPRKAEVCEADGVRAHGVFLRTFRDGCALVINLSGKERSLLLKIGGKTVPFRLSATGFFPWDPQMPPEEAPSPVFDLPRDGWEITPDSPNTLRAEFENGTFEFTLAEELPLYLVRRDYGDPVALLLDGEAVDASLPCRSLAQGFRELYRETGELRLAPGKHRLTLLGEPDDYPYLPAAFLAGNFAADSGVLSRYCNDGVGLGGYSGKIRLKRIVKIPAGTAALRAETLGLAAELAIDGTSLGRRICNPFLWKTGKISGTVRVELTILPSCGRLFGVKAFRDPDPKDPLAWLKDFGPKNDRPLLFYRR